jgi:hypothetical protein
MADAPAADAAVVHAPAGTTVPLPTVPAFSCPSSTSSPPQQPPHHEFGDTLREKNFVVCPAEGSDDSAAFAFYVSMFNQGGVAHFRSVLLQLVRWGQLLRLHARVVPNTKHTAGSLTARLLAHPGVQYDEKQLKEVHRGYICVKPLLQSTEDELFWFAMCAAQDTYGPHGQPTLQQAKLRALANVGVRATWSGLEQAERHQRWRALLLCDTAVQLQETALAFGQLLTHRAALVALLAHAQVSTPEAHQRLFL